MVRPCSMAVAAMTALLFIANHAPLFAARSHGVARALATVRASVAERERRDRAREEKAFRSTAAIVRVRNESADEDIPPRLACSVETYLRNRGFKVKDHRAIGAIIEKRRFSRWRSSGALRLLGQLLQTNLLVFLTVERCLVSSFVDEYRDVARHGNISFPHDEFVEFQLKASIFDASTGQVLFTRRDRQFTPYRSSNSGLIRQQAFDGALCRCIDNLFRDLN